MTKNNALKKLTIPLAAALVLAGSGCRKDKEPCCPEGMQPGDQMMAEDEVSDVTRLADLQVAAGSRTDSTLRAYHFSHTGLNSLGREKLDQISERGEDDKGEMVVYLDLSTAEADKSVTDARHDAVAQYLMSRGMTEDQFRLESGYNPDSTSLAVSARSAAGAAPAAEASGGASKTYAPAPMTK